MLRRRARGCRGIVDRRDFLRVGGAGVFGIPLSLETLLGSQRDVERAAKAKSVIVVFLKGGLSTIDTFDLKTEAPKEIRGEYKSIPTNVSGIEICEHLPRVARVMDKFSLIRSFTHRNSSHGPADHYMLTGYHPTAGFNAGLTPNNQRPSHGAIVSKLFGPRGSVPPYVCLPDQHPSAGSSYLGANASPFVIGADPNAGDFTVPDLAPPLNIESSRVVSRKGLLETVDRFHKSVEARANTDAGTLGLFRRKAFELMTSSSAKTAFSIDEETKTTRDAYGRHSLGQCCLMARRLVEAGVRSVLVDHRDWDTHSNNFETLKYELLPQLDSAMAMLFRDLAERGLLESTLVIVTGEFGRTPRINGNAGRDHWGPSFTVMLGGGGVEGGRVVGSTVRTGDKPAENPCGPEDLAATLYHLLGVDADHEFYTPEGRPVRIVNDGRVIRELL